VNGVLITLEGIDGSGKTTVANSLTRNLPRAQPRKKFLFTSEPTNGEAGKILRSHLAAEYSRISNKISQAKRMEELCLFMADHADHLARIVIPALDEGAVVISDRYADSTAAYQGVTLRGVVPKPLGWIRDVYAAWNVVPRITLFFSIKPENAVRRLRSRENREKFERLDFLNEVDRNFRKIIAMEPNRFVIVDGEMEADSVAEKALEAILEVI
jgi:dTMP kinase